MLYSLHEKMSAVVNERCFYFRITNKPFIVYLGYAQMCLYLGEYVCVSMYTTPWHPHQYL